MKAFTAKLDDDRNSIVATETVNMDGAPRIDISSLNENMRDGHGFTHSDVLDLSRREAERVALAILRAVAVSRRKHPPRKG